MQIKKHSNTLNIIQPNPKLQERIKYRSIGTRKYHPNKLIMYIQDGTRSNDATEEYITDEFGNEFKNYCIGTENRKFHKVSGGTSKASHLHE